MIILIVTSANVIMSQNIRKFEYGWIMNFGAFEIQKFIVQVALERSRVASKILEFFLVLKIFLAPLLLFFLMHTLHLLHFYLHLYFFRVFVIFQNCISRSLIG